MIRYIYQLPDWPQFRWDANRVAGLLAKVSRQQGLLIGQMQSLGFSLRQEAVLQTLTADVIETSEIEGEKLDADRVRSSIARRLGMAVAGLEPSDRNVEGIVEVMLDATRQYDQALTEDRLFGWHAALFPSGRSGMRKIVSGAWRNDEAGPMQVVSGPIGRETVHFEAPMAASVGREMNSFLQFFNAHGGVDPLLKSALAHLWFVTVHPFEDGNGRIARAVADMQLARSENSPQRFYSMSTQIRKERKSYYDVLNTTERGSMDVTIWVVWFLECLGRALDQAKVNLDNVLSKARFWEGQRDARLNERQEAMLNRLLDGFEGKLTTKKWAKIAKCSHDTALRDIQELVAGGVLVRNAGGGRSTSYSLRGIT